MNESKKQIAYLALDMETGAIVDENEKVYSLEDAKKLIARNEVDRTAMLQRFIFQFDGNIENLRNFYNSNK